MVENLRNTLKVDRVDQSELEHLFLSHFGNSTGISQDEIQYSHNGASDPALILKYDDDGELRSIEIGPGLQPGEIADLANKVSRFLLGSQESRVGQMVIFANLPAKGCFRYRDRFQLVPMPPDAPKPRMMLADHPILLQYKFADSMDTHISMLRRARVGRELELLCTALSVNIRGSIGNVVRHQWSLVGADDPVNLRSEYCQEAYTWPGANGLAEDYCSLDGIETVVRSPAQAYYTRFGISLGQPIDLPDVFDNLLDKYFACNADDRDRFMRASYWFQFAQRAYAYSQSGAYTALVSAIEALIPNAKSDNQCAECKRPLGAGPTRRFMEFVEQHAPGPGVNSRSRRQLYALRSALSHGGRLLHSDRFGWGGGMTSASISDSNDQSSMWLVVRLALVNWLSERKIAGDS